jgi:hypothetical protein
VDHAVDTLFITPVDNFRCGRRAGAAGPLSTGRPPRSVTAELRQQPLSTASTGAMMTMFRSLIGEKPNLRGVEKFALSARLRLAKIYK